MNWLTRYWHNLQLAARAFVGGAAAVDPATTAFGIDPSTFRPPEYGEYLAHSNGVYACAHLRSQLLSSLPLQLHRVNAQGEKTEVTTGALHELLTKVNPHWTFQRLIEMTELSLCLWGSAFWLLERGVGGRRPPTEMWWAPPTQIKVVPDAQNYIAGFLYEPSFGGEPLRYRPEEVIWLRFPNPLDQWSGLAPLAAARLAADTASAAMHSNRNVFANGIQLAGILGPPANSNLTEAQATEMEQTFGQRFKGADKAHRIAVMRYETKFQQVSMTPRDAEFIESLKWSLEDIARAFGVPLDLLGGQRTYANVEASERIIWAHTIRPEAQFIATELTEQLLPMFGPGQDEADLVEFDFSEVEALKEAETDAWDRAERQIKAGAITVNEWRADQGLDPVKWGDSWWSPINLVPITSAESSLPEPADEMPALPEPSMEEEAAVARLAGAFGIKPIPDRTARAIVYGSPEHERAWRLFVRRTEAHERRVAEKTAELMRNQRTAVLARLKADRGIRSAAEAADDPFDKPAWIKRFRTGMRPVFLSIIEDAGAVVADDLGVGTAFDVSDPNVVRFLEQQSQFFGRQVNQTTWDQLKAALGEGIDAKEGIDELVDRVESVMTGRIRDAEMIARTTVTGAYNGGTIESWRQSGVVRSKTWISALDNRTRPTHVEAHGQTVGLDQNFVVGGVSGPGPGLIPKSGESENCRCSLVPVIDVEAEPERAITPNGHRGLAKIAQMLEMAP